MFHAATPVDLGGLGGIPNRPLAIDVTGLDRGIDQRADVDLLVDDEGELRGVLRGHPRSFTLPEGSTSYGDWAAPRVRATDTQRPGTAGLTTATPAGPDRDPRAEALPSVARGGHGDSAVGLYLHVEGVTDQEDEARRVAEARGYRASSGELGCDQGAAEALGITMDDDPPLAAALYFDDRADAEQVRDVLEADGLDTVGIASVRMYCAD